MRDLIISHQVLPLQLDSHSLLLAVATRPIPMSKMIFVSPPVSKSSLYLADCKELEGAIRRLYGRAVNSDTSQGKDITKMSWPIWLKSVVMRFKKPKTLAKMKRRSAVLSIRFYSMRYVKAHRIFTLSLMKSSTSPPALRWYLGRNQPPCVSFRSSPCREDQDLIKTRYCRASLYRKMDRIKIRLNADTADRYAGIHFASFYVGEKIVLRLLDSSAANLNIDKLGYSEAQKQIVFRCLATTTRHDLNDWPHR